MMLLKTLPMAVHHLNASRTPGHPVQALSLPCSEVGLGSNSQGKTPKAAQLESSWKEERKALPTARMTGTKSEDMGKTDGDVVGMTRTAPFTELLCMKNCPVFLTYI